MKFLITILLLICPTLVVAQDITDSVKKAKETCQSQLTQATADVSLGKESLAQAQNRLIEAQNCLDTANRALPKAEEQETQPDQNSD